MSSDVDHKESTDPNLNEEISIENIFTALRPISGPNNQSLIDQGMIKDVSVVDREVRLTVVFNNKISRDTRHAVEDVIYDTLVKLEGIDDAEIEVEIHDFNESSTDSTSHSNPPSEPGLSVYGSGGAQKSEGSSTAGSTNHHSSNPPVSGGVSQVKHLIAIGSGKGGVGKSTIAANLALSLVKSGARVGFCDIDLYGPSAPIIFGVSGAKVKADGELKKFIPIEAYGIKVMSIGFLIDEETPVIWRGPR